MAVIQSGNSSDQWTVDATSKAGRVTLYDSTGRQISLQGTATFVASATFTPAATPNDLVTIYGSASRTVCVVSLMMGTTNTAAGSQTFFIQKKNAVPSGGVFVAATMVPLDSSDGAATATQVGHYTTDPTAGASDGNINIVRVASPVLVPATFAGIVQKASFEMLPTDAYGILAKPVVLRGVGQGVAVNFADAALVAGQIHYYTIVWTEEA